MGPAAKGAASTLCAISCLHILKFTWNLAGNTGELCSLLILLRK